MDDFAGTFPAVVTPFDDDGDFQPDRFSRLLKRVYDAGAQGVYVCGQTGEGLAQSVDQRKLVGECAVHCSPPGKKVIIHVGALRTGDAIELARHAARIGAHAVSSLPPLGGYGFAEVRNYYSRLASASDLPVFIYYFPEMFPTIRGAEQLLELCATPNVIGLKFTDFDLFTMATLKEEGKVVLNGRDEIFAAGLLMGADGGIGSFYNVAPEGFAELYASCRMEDWKRARALQGRINALIRVVLRFPLVAAIKTILEWSGVPCGPVIGPRLTLTADDRRRLQRVLITSGFEEQLLTYAEPVYDDLPHC